jgi:7,8-dihydro-6-hydroxymethylpterin-pyrophosphokinase
LSKSIHLVQSRSASLADHGTISAEAVLKRGRKIRRYIRSLDLDLVVVVTHAGVMPGFCEDRLYRSSDAYEVSLPNQYVEARLK